MIIPQPPADVLVSRIGAEPRPARLMYYGIPARGTPGAGELGIVAVVQYADAAAPASESVAIERISVAEPRPVYVPSYRVTLE